MKSFYLVGIVIAGFCSVLLEFALIGWFPGIFVGIVLTLLLPAGWLAGLVG